LSSTARVVDRSSKALSPVLFVAAALCFLLPFGGVSCNTTAAKTLVNSAGSSSGSSQVAQAGACLDALNGFNLATYSGLNLAFGTAGSTANTGPAACQTGTASTIPSSVQPDSVKTDVQPFILAAGAVIIAGLLLSVILLRQRRLRGLISALSAAIAGGLLIIGQVQVQKQITDKIAAQFSSGSTSSSLPAGLNINFADYFNVNWAIGAFIVIAVLAVAFLLNLAAAIAGPGAAVTGLEGVMPDPPPWQPPPAPPPG